MLEHNSNTLYNGAADNNNEWVDKFEITTIENIQNKG
jgi:hypothetical protein